MKGHGWLVIDTRGEREQDGRSDALLGPAIS